MKKLILCIFLILLACSKDSPTPDTPTVTYTLSVSASDGGNVDPSSGTHNENSTVVVTATPSTGFEFTGWSGDASGTDNPLTVTMTGNKTITATFSRIQYTLNVGVVGQGSVSQEITSAAKTEEQYNSGDVVRLTATPDTGWIFNSWSGSSTQTTNEIDVAIDGTKSVTATFEEQISNVLQDGVFLGVGKWKIRKNNPTGEESGKNNGCSVSEIIFRTDGSFTIVTGTTTVTGQFNVDSNTTISLTQSQSPFGTITNLVLTNRFISFSIELTSGCSENADGDKDETYNEATDTSLPPVMSLIGSSTINLIVGDTFTDPGATAEDNIDGDLTASITTSGTVDTSSTGTYTIEYSVSDAAGNITSVTRVVVVNLDLPPTIILAGSSIVTLLVGEPYTEEGCIATDQEDGDITASITTSGTVDVSNTGTYTLVYSVSDSGNNFVSVTRTVIVNSIPDATPPVITLTGSSTINLTVGDNWQDTGGTANDNVDGDLTFSMTASYPVDSTFSSVTGYNTLTFTTTGTFIITYSVSDAAGNTTTVDRIIIVSADTTADTTPPVITLVGSSTIYLTIGETFIDPGATATPGSNGDVSDVSVSGTADTATVGSYILTYSVISALSGLSASVTRTVIVQQSQAAENCSIDWTLVSGNINQTLSLGDTIEPIVIRIDTDCSTITLGFPYGPLGSNTPGFTGFANGADFFPNGIDIFTTENSNNTLLLNNGQTTFTISGTLSSEPTSGEYPFYISVGNGYNLPPNAQEASPRQEATTTVTIRGQFTILDNSTADTTAPVINLVGSSTINLTVGDTFTDPGATATDNIDGNITSSITTSGTVNTSTAGTYTIAYSVSDAASNTASVNRTVIVLEQPKTYVPDDNFEQVLIDLGYDDVLDDYVLTNNIINVERFLNSDTQNKNISNLTGIEDFINLERLEFSNNNINNIDLSQNVKLRKIDLSRNQLNSIDLSNNNLIGYGGEWNGQMADLSLAFNNLTSLNVSNLNYLYRLFIDGNNITSLQFGNNSYSNLVRIDAAGLNISSLDLSIIPNLKILKLSGSSISSLDVSQYSVNSQTGLYSLNTSGTPNLNCIQVNQTQLNDIPNGWTKDSTHFYSTDCSNDTLGIKVESGQGGSVSISSRLQNQTLTGGESNLYNNGYHPGEIVTLTAIPDSGKTFNGWSCSAHCGANSFTSSLTIEVVLDFDTIDISASFN